MIAYVYGGRLVFRRQLVDATLFQHGEIRQRADVDGDRSRICSIFVIVMMNAVYRRRHNFLIGQGERLLVRHCSRHHPRWYERIVVVSGVGNNRSLCIRLIRVVMLMLLNRAFDCLFCCYTMFRITLPMMNFSCVGGSVIAII